jgi:hypothetical protein
MKPEWKRLLRHNIVQFPHSDEKKPKLSEGEVVLVQGYTSRGQISI